MCQGIKYCIDGGNGNIIPTYATIPMNMGEYPYTT
jgi:hypothetical protein